MKTKKVNFSIKYFIDFNAFINIAYNYYLDHIQLLI